MKIPSSMTLALLKDRSKPAHSRAQHLILSSNEIGLDLVGPLAQYIEEVDELAARQEAAEKARPLQPDVYFDACQGPGGVGDMVMLLVPGGILLCPLERKIDGLRRGDFVLVDRSSGKVVARDGRITPVGEIVRIEEVPADGSGQVVVRQRDERLTAYLSDDARASADLRPGAEAVFDAQRRIVYRLLPCKVDGSDLLARPETLSGFTLESLGAPHPVIGEILRIVDREILDPEWKRAMRPRLRHSYLLFGPSGSGKTSSIKVLANLVADRVEQLTGVREPRVVFCDAETFYSPYFGETEARIGQFFRKLAALGRRELTTRDGRKIIMPLIVVFEEIEGLVRFRGEGGGSSHLFDRTLSKLLQEMDSASNGLDVPLIFISTSNKKMLMDFAARRRFSEREAYFGPLGARAARAVLEKKVPADMPIHPRHGPDRASAREDLIRSVIHYLFGAEDDGEVVEVVMRDSSRRSIHRRNLVTGALLESAVSKAIDDAMDAAAACGELLGLEGEAVVEALSQQFEALSSSIRPHNVRDYAPHLFDEEDVLIAGVNPRHRGHRRPVSGFAV